MKINSLDEFVNKKNLTKFKSLVTTLTDYVIGISAFAMLGYAASFPVSDKIMDFLGYISEYNLPYDLDSDYTFSLWDIEDSIQNCITIAGGLTGLILTKLKRDY